MDGCAQLGAELGAERARGKRGCAAQCEGRGALGGWDSSFGDGSRGDEERKRQVRRRAGGGLFERQATAPVWRPRRHDGAAINTLPCWPSPRSTPVPMCRERPRRQPTGATSRLDLRWRISCGPSTAELPEAGSGARPAVLTARSAWLRGCCSRRSAAHPSRVDASLFSAGAAGVTCLIRTHAWATSCPSERCARSGGSLRL
jgi:hypothetical protein